MNDISLAMKIAELDETGALEAVRARINNGDDPQAILLECREGLDEIGRRYESGEYFIADLVYAGNIFKDMMDMLGPELRRASGNSQTAGKVAIGTVKDDIHDIGKNLVATMLDASGFEVLDLGVDVPAAVICDRIKEENLDILALSCLLTSTVDSMEDIIGEVSRAGLRNRVKIIVGGIPLNLELAVSIGADAYGDNAAEAVTRCRELMGRAVK